MLFCLVYTYKSHKNIDVIRNSHQKHIIPAITHYPQQPFPLPLPRYRTNDRVYKRLIGRGWWQWRRARRVISLILLVSGLKFQQSLYWHCFGGNRGMREGRNNKLSTNIRLCWYDSFNTPWPDPLQCIRYRVTLRTHWRTPPGLHPLPHFQPLFHRRIFISIYGWPVNFNSAIIGSRGRETAYLLERSLALTGVAGPRRGRFQARAHTHLRVLIYTYTCKGRCFPFTSDPTNKLYSQPPPAIVRGDKRDQSD